MKRLSLLIGIITFFAFQIAAQPCFPQGLTFTSQIQIDSFPINYPECSEIIGDLKVISDNITSLDSLYQLTRVNGKVIIESTSLQNLSGFENLQVIKHYLFLKDNYKLERLSGLNNLDTVGGLSLWANILITDFNELQNLKSCRGISASWNNDLINFSGLDNITSLDGELYLTYNWSLQNFEGLNNVKTVNSVFVAWNENLENTDGLESVEYINGELTFFGNGYLENLDGLSNLDSISGSLNIGSEYSLNSIAGLNNISPESIKHLTIANNASLTSCNVESICNYLASPNGVVTIYNNGSGCNSPGEIASECDIALPCLPYGDYFFTNQREIDSFQSYYPNCNTLMGEVLIRGADIKNLSGLSNINAVSEKLVIAGNPSLQTLDGLDSLSFVGDFFYIGGLDDWPYSYEGNDSLIDISALSNLTDAGSIIVIAYNELLSDLTGLENMDDFWDLSIFDNPSLSNCAIESICSHLSENGYTEIHDNAPGCNSAYEVRQVCLVSIKEGELLRRINISPNPFTTSTTIEYILDQSEEVTLTIFNHVGKQVDLINEHQQSGKQSIHWQPKGLPPGMYYFTLQAGDQVASGKLLLID